MNAPALRDVSLYVTRCDCGVIIRLSRGQSQSAHLSTISVVVNASCSGLDETNCAEMKHKYELASVSRSITPRSLLSRPFESTLCCFTCLLYVLLYVPVSACMQKEIHVSSGAQRNAEMATEAGIRKDRCAECAETKVGRERVEI